MNHAEQFRNELLPSNTLYTAIDWIQTYMAPEDVFPEEALVEWAEANGFEREE